MPSRPIRAAPFRPRGPERRRLGPAGAEGYNDGMTTSADLLFPSSLKSMAGGALEAALNHALALDPDTRDGLRALDGRRVALHMAAPPLSLQVRVDGDQLRVGPVDAAVEPDLAVRSTLAMISDSRFAPTSMRDSPLATFRAIEADAVDVPTRPIGAGPWPTMPCSRCQSTR